MPPQAPSLKGRALRLLSTREYSRVELAHRLKPHAAQPAELEALLDEMQAKGFVSEQRVVESVLHRRAGKLGATRIRQELLDKGLAPETVRGAVANLQATELERAREVWRKKFGASMPVDASPGTANATTLARQVRFLAQHGFGSDTIRRVVVAPADTPDQMPD